MGFFALSLFVFAFASTQIGMDESSASSTYSSGNLIGSPEFSSDRALSAGSGYWSSAGAHEAGEVVTWSGRIPAARSIKGVQVSWVHAPSEVRVLTSPDGSNFEEAACWQPSGKHEDSFVQTLEFSRTFRAQVVTIAMRTAGPSSYFAISDVSLQTASDEPIMLISGVTSEEEMCVVTENGNTAQAGALVTLQSCNGAIAAGDGRELWKMSESGQLVSVVGSKCVVLGGNSAIGGGVVELSDCEAAAEAGDGRSFWELSPSAQLSMARGGGYCMVLSGSVTSSGKDVSKTATAKATATKDAAHSASHVLDGDSSTFWSSPAADAITGPVSMTLELAETTRVDKISIDWQDTARNFQIQVAGASGSWSVFGSMDGNTLSRTTTFGASALAKRVRIIMSEPSSNSASYGIHNVNVFAMPQKMGVQDCSEASLTGDARDKFFVQQVSEFDPAASAPVRSAAPLLVNSIQELGQTTASLISSLPKLESCKGASMLEVSMLSETDSTDDTLVDTINSAENIIAHYTKSL